MSLRRGGCHDKGTTVSLKKPTKAQIKIINQLIDKLMVEYEDDHKIIFASESERIKHLFLNKNRSIKKWKRSRNCVVPGCTKRSIKRSHAIPRSMSLKRISDNGELITPEPDPNTETLVAKRIGIAVASTFPGFCSEHEHLFENFERKKIIDENSHVYLQVYRTACRELFRTNFVIEQYEHIVTSYCALRDNRLFERIKETAIEAGLPHNISISGLSVSSDPIIEWSNSQIFGVRSLYTHLKDKIIPAIEKAVFGGCENDIYVCPVNIDLEFPVALNGSAGFYVGDNGKHQVHQIIGVIPHAGNTLLIFAGHVDDKAYIDFYISTWLTNALSMVSMIESWMVNGTDQWYLSPMVWDKLSDIKKTKIMNDIMACEQNIGQEYGVSIFSDIRISLLKMLKDKHEPTQDKDYWEFVDSQRKKMV